MELRKLFLQRESCRSYIDKAVTAEDIERLAELAGLSPSAKNSQPWTLLAVLSEEKVKLIADAVSDGGRNPFAKECPAFIVLLEDGEAARNVPIDPRGHNCAFFDMGLVTAHLCLAATEAGLSSCILGWFNDDMVKAALDLDDRDVVAMVVALGYGSDLEPRPKKRKPLKENLKMY